MLIDFHTHTSASDGELAPADLLQRAARLGIERFAITDHDTVDGYLSVRGSALAGQVGLVSGVEFSCQWSGVTVHIVGLDMDVEHPAMAEGLGVLDQARRERGAKIARRLEKLGFPDALAGARQEAGSSQLGRPHFATWMVAQGHVESTNAAFDKYLGQGKPGDVKAFWPTLDEVTRWVVSAGGIAVIAHPLKYKLTRSKLRRLVGDFKAAGGTAVELINGRQTADQSAVLTRLARDCELAVSVGSDFHRDSPYGPELGMRLTVPEGLSAVTDRWQQRDLTLTRASL